MNYLWLFCVPKTLTTVSHHRKSWLFPDHFIILSRWHITPKKGPYCTWEQRIPGTSVQPDLDHCLLKKCAAMWGMSLLHMRTGNTHMTCTSGQAWSGPLPAKKNALQCDRCPYPTWEQLIPIWPGRPAHPDRPDLGFPICWKKNVPKHVSCPFATWEPWISIWTCASTQPDLDFAVCWKKFTATWELSLQHMKTVNIHLSLRIHAA